MDRPQWSFRDGRPHHLFRWRASGFRIGLQYRTLDVEPGDEDNFFKVSGQPLEEPAFRDESSAAQIYRRQVAARNAQRIAGIAEHVDLYLKIKEWKARLRHASADLEWAFEPYRRQAKESIVANELQIKELIVAQELVAQELAAKELTTKESTVVQELRRLLTSSLQTKGTGERR